MSADAPASQPRAGAALRRRLVAPVGAYVAIVMVAVVQSSTSGTVDRVLAAGPYALAAAVLVAAVRVAPATVGAPSALRWVQGLALVGAALGLWLTVALLWALPDGLGTPAGFYEVKVRVTSPVGDHNTAAGLLVVGVVASAVAAARDRRWTPALALAAAGMAATLSRGGALVLAVVAAGAWWLASTRPVAARLGVAAVGSLAALAGLTAVLDTAPPEGGPPAAGVLGTSVVARAQLAARGVELLLSRPMLGVGFGEFGAFAGDLPPPQVHAHQLVAHAGAEGGVVVAVAVAALAVLLVVRAWRLPASALRDVVLLGGVGLVLHAQFEWLGGLAGYEVLVALLLGLATGAGAHDCARRPPGAR